MTMKQILFVSGLGVAALGLGGAMIVSSGNDALSPDKAEQAELEELAAALNGEENLLEVFPAEPEPENPDLVPHATPEEAAAIATDFFARPAPADAELAAMAPFEGTENVPVARCGPYWPEAAATELDVMTGPPDRRMKELIYERMNIRRTLDTGDCTCAGKVAPFEPVAAVLRTLKQRHGTQTDDLIYPYRDENMRLGRVLQRLCGGPF